MMDIQSTSIPEIILLTPRKFEDPRGFFMETFRENVFCDAIGQDMEFVQDNLSFSKEAFTVRGLHYQLPPHPQGKLIKCTYGEILDVAVDVRTGSPHYGQHVQVKLSAKTAKQLWVPPGFLHGFVTLEPQTVVQYKCTDYYVQELDRGVMWNDPALKIDWGIDPDMAVLSDKDTKASSFASFTSPFTYK